MDEPIDSTYKIAQNIVQNKYENIPYAAIESAKKQILDCLGVALAGSSAQGVRELIDMCCEWGGRGQSSIFYYGIKIPLPNAALINASMAHACDFDDTHDNAIIHPGVVTVITGFAVSEYIAGISGKAFVTAITLGTDLMCRLGLATNPNGSRINTGWHLTSIYGYLGAAAVAGKLLEFDEIKMMNALGIAYHQSAGNGQCVIDGALTKRLGPGFAAKGGIISALLAGKGITGSNNCLEGKMGMYKLYHRGVYNQNELTNDLGIRFEGINLSFKPYPSCRGTHPFIDATLSLIQEHDIKVNQIDTIDVFHGEGLKILCQPIKIKQRPRNITDSQFSIPWAVAVTIHSRKVTLDHFSNVAIEDRDILEICRKIIPRLDKRYDGTGLEHGRVRIRTKSGEILSREIGPPLGSPLNPMSKDDFIKKFLDCAAHANRQIIEKDLFKLVDMVDDIEKVDDITEMITLVRKISK